MPARRLIASVATLGCLVILSACSSSSKPGPTVTKYVDPSVPASTAPASSSASPSPSVTAPSLPASLPRIPGDCDGRLPLDLIAHTIGESLPGTTAFVVGKPDASIHRVSYINCRYGLAKPDATPTVEIQVSLYGTTAQAAARIAPTVTDYEDNGATGRKTSAGGIPATVLTGGTGAGYDTATLILAFGQRTVAVSLSDDISSDKQPDDLTELAVLAVKRTQ